MFGLFKRKPKEKKVMLIINSCSIPNSYKPLLKIGEVCGTVYKPESWSGFRLITNDGVEFANVYDNGTGDYTHLNLHGKSFLAVIDYFNAEHPEYGLNCREIKIFE